MPDLLSIYDAAARGIERIRCPDWAHPLEHLVITIERRRPGFWLQFYSPLNFTINGRDPIAMALGNPGLKADNRIFVSYLGPQPDSAAYRAAAQRYGLDECIRFGLQELHPREEDRRQWRRTPWPELGGSTPVEAHAAGHDRAVLDLIRQQMREKLA